MWKAHKRSTFRYDVHLQGEGEKMLLIADELLSRRRCCWLCPSRSGFPGGCGAGLPVAMLKACGG
ncbi:hypothetical protein J4730_11800 [Klebsiella pneumoniae]|uniref:Uncharacterized protein n=1 Tax=Klebsiella pneumoniae TaxID=573 RepID=A0A939SQG2_KLEPN|nr:hypothetical protein [Klebsiella pneumoniae]